MESQSQPCSPAEAKAAETAQCKLTMGLCRVDILRPSKRIIVCVIYWGGQCLHIPKRESGGQRTTWRGWFSPPTMRIKLRPLCCSKCPGPLSHLTSPTLCVFLNRLVVENKSQTLEGKFYRQVVSNYRQYRFAFY